MIIIPAIDLQQGQCVRLRQGQFNQSTVYPQSAIDLAGYYRECGAHHLHVVDLDGARQGEICQLDLIRDLHAAEVCLQAGGGIRSLESAKACLAAGINKLVIGSIAITNLQLTHAIIDYAGAENIVLALDINWIDQRPMPAIHGWQTSSDRDLWQVCTDYQQSGIQTILCTNIACDGMMQGPDLALYQQAIERFPEINWQASGGIRDESDIEALAEMGVHAVILGRTLYEGHFNLTACVRRYASC